MSIQSMMCLIILTPLTRWPFHHPNFGFWISKLSFKVYTDHTDSSVRHNMGCRILHDGINILHFTCSVKWRHSTWIMHGPVHATATLVNYTISKAKPMRLLLFINWDHSVLKPSWIIWACLKWSLWKINKVVRENIGFVITVFWNTGSTDQANLHYRSPALSEYLLLETTFPRVKSGLHRGFIVCVWDPIPAL